MYGAQAMSYELQDDNLFENDVEMYGAQAQPLWLDAADQFENDVEMYGAQATKPSNNTTKPV